MNRDRGIDQDHFDLDRFKTTLAVKEKQYSSIVPDDIKRSREAI
jgi:hypothetical protein